MPCRTGTFAYLHTPTSAISREIQAKTTDSACLVARRDIAMRHKMMKGDAWPTDPPARRGRRRDVRVRLYVVGPGGV
jgi:hypothetical protein